MAAYHAKFGCSMLRVVIVIRKQVVMRPSGRINPDIRKLENYYAPAPLGGGIKR